MPKRSIFVSLALLITGTVFWAAAQERTVASNAAPAATASSASTMGSKSAAPGKPDPVGSDTTARLEGEKRFKANCGRCHAAPHKFPPRMMATILRHMRVRATITDEDARLILNYMTQ